MPVAADSARRRHLRAASMLLLATVCWAVSFPVMKALTAHQSTLVPGMDSWFFSALGVAWRFGLAGFCLLLVGARRMGALTRDECWQGVGMGVFGSLGILFQMDGLAHTEASTSAFLTQCYVFFLPLWQAAVQRRPPSRLIIGACVVVLAGVGVLSGLTWQNFRLGRGELETLLASLLFTGQILWLQRPRYEGNDVTRFTVVMFAVMVLCMLPLIALSAPDAAACWRAYASVPSLTFLAVLVVPCTLGGYLLMNHWQREVTASEAGLIYCGEPVFASALALWLPAWLATFAQIQYANETLTWRLLLGGGLILGANAVVQLVPTSRPERRTGQPG